MTPWAAASQGELVLSHRPDLVVSERGISVAPLAQWAITFRPIQFPVYPDLDNIRFPAVMHGPSTRGFVCEGVQRSKPLANARRWR